MKNDLKIHTTITHKRHQKSKFTFKVAMCGFLVSTTILSTAVSLPTNALGDNFSTVVYAEQINSTNVGSLLSTSREETEELMDLIAHNNIDTDILVNINNYIQEVTEIVNGNSYNLTTSEKNDADYIYSKYKTINLDNITGVGGSENLSTEEIQTRIDSTLQNLAFLVGDTGSLTQKPVTSLPVQNTSQGSFSNFKQGTPISFTDVPNRDDIWYYEAVTEASKLGIIEGMGDGTFKPDNSLTYAESMTLACRVNAIYFNRESELSTSKGTGTHWASGIEAYARKYDILQSTFTFNLDDTCTREAMAYMFSRALPDFEYGEVNSLNYENYINEVANAPGALNISYVSKLYLMGIMIGDNDGFRLNENLKRSEAAAMIVRLAVPDKRVRVNPNEEGFFEQYQLETLQLVNNSRAEAGLPPLKLSKVMCAAAEQLAWESTQGAKPHKRLNYFTASGLLEDACSIFTEWCVGGSSGENWAQGYSASYVHNNWMSSEGHRDAILRDYGEGGYLGVARVKDSNGKYHWYEEFYRDNINIYYAGQIY